MQFCRSHVGVRSAVGAVIGGDITPCYRITHGCTPLDGIYHRVTRAEGAVIYEIDGEPAVGMINRLYGSREFWREREGGSIS